MAVQEQKGDHVVEEVEVALGKTGDFFERHKSLIVSVVTVIVVLVAGYFGVKYLYLAPRENKAAEAMFAAQRYFEMDSINTALNGNAQYAGFIEIADTYGATKSGKLANYYIGLIYLHDGKFEEAAANLEKFKTKEPVLSIMSKQALGDAYLELGQNEKALAAYRKAANTHRNEELTPKVMMRIAMVEEMQQQYAQAAATYEKIRNEYPMSAEARNVETHIARLQAKSGK